MNRKQAGTIILSILGLDILLGLLFPHCFIEFGLYMFALIIAPVIGLAVGVISSVVFEMKISLSLILSLVCAYLFYVPASAVAVLMVHLFGYYSIIPLCGH